MQFKKTQLLALLLSSLTLAGCGGGGAAPNTVSGVAQKGPYEIGTTVIGYKLNPDGSRDTYYDAEAGRYYFYTITTKTTDNFGSYSFVVPWSGPTEIVIEGNYLNEVTGASESGQVTAIANVTSAMTVNVNALTEIVAEKVKKNATTNSVASALVTQLDTANQDIQTVFSLSTTPASVNLLTQSDDSKKVLAVSASILELKKILDDDSVNDTLSSLTNSFDAQGAAMDISVIESIDSDLDYQAIEDNLKESLGEDVNVDLVDETSSTTEEEKVIAKALRKLNDTGQITSLSNIAGQDASYGRDAFFSTLLKLGTSSSSDGFEYFKLDSNGVALANNATSWSCVRDNVTGLTWYLPDSAQTFATSFSSAMCGIPAADWRLPSLSEAQGLINFGKSGVAAHDAIINLPSVTSTQNYIWTDSELGNNQAIAIAVEDGATWTLGDSNSAILLPVAGKSYVYSDSELPANCTAQKNGSARYEDVSATYGEGVYRDRVTNLVWDTALKNSANWQTALNQTDDWRVPNVKELVSLVDTGCANPAWNQALFGTDSAVLWSSTYDANNNTNAWAVDFASGEVFTAAQTGSKAYLLVRDPS